MRSGTKSMIRIDVITREINSLYVTNINIHVEFFNAFNVYFNSGRWFVLYLCWSRGPEIGTSSTDWAQLSRFHLKAKTESSL
jgi:hypothetical protein